MQEVEKCFLTFSFSLEASPALYSIKTWRICVRARGRQIHGNYKFYLDMIRKYLILCFKGLLL